MTGPVGFRVALTIKNLKKNHAFAHVYAYGPPGTHNKSSSQFVVGPPLAPKITQDGRKVIPRWPEMA